MKMASTSSVCTEISRIVVHLCNFVKDADRYRLQFLKETVANLESYFREQSLRYHSFRVLQNIVLRRLVDVLNLLEGVERANFILTQNFDITELKLRGYLNEMQALYPLDAANPPAPSALIQDVCARLIWKNAFGEEAFAIYSDFLDVLRQHDIIADGKNFTEKAHQYLRFFVNYPTDDVVSTYKFNRMMQLFGPPQRFAENFSNIVTKAGFVGLTNRIQAKQLLTDDPNPCSLIIRLSRTKPEFLALSFKDENGSISHRVNKDSQGRTIPVDTFIQTKFPNYHMLDRELDVAGILEASHEERYPLTKYAEYGKEYLL